MGFVERSGVFLCEGLNRIEVDGWSKLFFEICFYCEVLVYDLYSYGYWKVDFGRCRLYVRCGYKFGF